MKRPQTARATVALCHATGSAERPFVLIRVAKAAAAAHVRHGDVEPTGGVCPTPAAGTGGGVAGPQGDGGHVAVTLCHATASETNPYVRITVDDDGAFHGHLGRGHQNGEDIIPPSVYEGVSYSQNWDAAGRAIFEAGCEIAAEAAAATAATTVGAGRDQPASGLLGATASGAAPATEARSDARDAPASGVLGTVASGRRARADDRGILGTVAHAVTGELPFTGLPVWIAAVVGAGLTTAGLGLRRRLRSG